MTAIRDDESQRFVRNVGNRQATLICGDAIRGMDALETDSIDLAIVDPPYGASTTSTWQLPHEHALNGFGGEWKLAGHAWDLISGSSSFQLTMAYLKSLKRVVKPTGSFFVHSTYHNSGIVNVACQMADLEIINEIVWFKRNAFPNLANRRLTASHETIHWVHTGSSKKRQYRFNADAVRASSFSNDSIKSAGKQMRTVWDIPNNKRRGELQFGKHPTQKPLSVSERLLLVAGVEGGTLLAPFAGSGTEMIAGLQYGMSVVGFEIEQEYFDLCSIRLDGMEANTVLPFGES